MIPLKVTFLNCVTGGIQREATKTKSGDIILDEYRLEKIAA